MQSIFCVAAILFGSGLVSAPILAQQPKATADWGPFSFLVGEWSGEGAGKPGEASGGFSFAFELQGRVLVRRNYAEYPATKDKPGFRHDDLMVLYHESPSGAAEAGVKAIYFDSEGHVIHYRASLSEDQKTLTLQSEPVPSEPQYRFIYRRIDPTNMKFEFDIAPPGKPDGFSKYIEGSLRKKAG